MIEVGKKYLITTDGWFRAPDGQNYQAVFGTVKAVATAEDTLGVRPNGKSTNWYVEIGCLVIAGCQVHYAVRTDECHFGDAPGWNTHNGDVVRHSAPCSIFNADA